MVRMSGSPSPSILGAPVAGSTCGHAGNARARMEDVSTNEPTTVKKSKKTKGSEEGVGPKEQN